jgi:hypothetical protein
MKNKIGFIMPRLFGATVIAGVAALIVTILFKLLLGLTLLAGVVTLVMRLVTNRGKRLLQYGQGEMHAFGNWENFANSSPATNTIQPVAGFETRKATIVPID